MPRGAKGFADVFNRKAAEKQAEKVKERQAKRGGFGFWKPKKGTSVVRVLPPGSEKLTGNGLMGKLVFKHFLWWDNKARGLFTSGFLTDPEIYSTCPIQAALDKVQSVVPEDQFKRLKARPRAFFNVLVRKTLDEHGNPIDEDNWGKVVICDAPSTMFDFVQSSFTNDEIGFFIDPSNGADLIITATGDNLERRYQYQIKPGAWTPVLDTIEETDALLEKLPDIDNITKISKDNMEKQIAAGKSILAWATKFGDVDSDLGMSQSSLDALMDSAAGSKSDGGTSSTEATSATATAEEPKKEEPKKETEKPAMKGDTPECFGDFKSRNPGVTDGNPTDAQCQDCTFQLPCSFE